MHFHGLQRRILGSPARVAVLSAMLAAPDVDLTGREAARRAGVSQARAIEALHALEAEGACWRRSVGRASLWRIDRRHFIAQTLAPVADLDRAAFDELRRMVSGPLKGAGAVEAYIWGSVARGDERGMSDVDVVAVFPGEPARRKWERRLDDLQNAVQHRFGNELHAIAYLRAQVGRGGPRRVLERARAEGIALGGAD